MTLWNILCGKIEMNLLMTSFPWTIDLCCHAAKSIAYIESHSVVSDSLQPHGLCRPWNSPGQILEWAATACSKGSSQPRDQTQVSCMAGGFFTSWATREAQEYRSGSPIPSPVDLPDPGIEVGSPALQTDSLPTELSGKHNEKQNLQSKFYLSWFIDNTWV